MIHLEKICSQVIKIAQEAGNLIQNRRQTLKPIQIESKGLHDFVTSVDKAAEEFIYLKLKKLIEGAGFLGEEQTHNSKSDGYMWVVDPLDGTTNFLHNLNPYAVSIALMRENQVIMGVVYEVVSREVFFAWENSRAYLNKSPIKVSEVSTINDALIATGFPYSNYSKIDPFMKSFKYFMENSHGLRRLGSAATDLAYVACGRFEAFYEYDLKVWDVAAGAFIVQQAGGNVCDFSGGDHYLFGKEMIAANENLFEEFLGYIRKTMHS